MNLTQINERILCRIHTDKCDKTKQKKNVTKNIKCVIAHAKLYVRYTTVSNRYIHMTVFVAM